MWQGNYVSEHEKDPNVAADNLILDFRHYYAPPANTLRKDMDVDRHMSKVKELISKAVQMMSWHQGNLILQ